MVLRDLGMSKSTLDVTPGALSSERLENFYCCAGPATSETPERYHVGEVSRRCVYELPDSAPSRLVSRCRLSGTSDEESHDERLQGNPAHRVFGATCEGVQVEAIVCQPQAVAPTVLEELPC